MPKQNVPQVFLDANIVIRSGKPPGGPELERMGDLVDAGIVTVLTTDLTITEIAKKHADNDFEVVKEIARPHFRKIVEEAVKAKIPVISKPELRDFLGSKYLEEVSDQFKSLKASRLAIDDIKPSTVFQAYAERSGFFSGDGKKDQFPDAFIFECLKKVATANSKVIIVSDDGDFDQPTAREEHITLVRSLPELFVLLGYEMAAPPVEDFLNEQTDRLVELIEEELNQWGLNGDVEDSEVYEISVTEIEVLKLTAFKPVEQDDSILVICRVEVKGSAEFSHPDWDNAAYDSEDKVLIPFDDVSGETEIELRVDMSISVAVDDDGQPEGIEFLRFRNSNFQYITLHPYEDYK